MLAVNYRNLVPVLAAALLWGFGGPDAQAQSDIYDEVEHHYVDNGGVRLHYVSVGEGPLVVLIHGFPDFWYTWRHQIEALKDDFQVVAIDQRGYNLSAQPEGVDAYAVRYLTGDVATIIDDTGAESATVVGHDWGGLVAWEFAFAFPQMTDGVAILNSWHPTTMSREMAINVNQRRASAYASAFIAGSSDDADIFFGGPMTPASLAGWVTDEAARSRYIEAFERSDFSGMLNYYKANWPAPPEPGTSFRLIETPRPSAPVLVMHGLQDRYLLPSGLNGLWELLDGPLTLVTVPEAGHFVQQDAPELVSSTLLSWLTRQSGG